MDEYLEDAWQNADPPFHGGTIHNDSSLTLSQLRDALTTIVDWLERRHGRGSKLLMLEDWHEHDGFKKEGARIEWPALRAILAKDQRLRKTNPGDFNVYRAVYPISGEWLLRWYISDDDDGSLKCEFTFSAGDSELREVSHVLRLTVPITIQPSDKYFRACYGG